MLHRPNSYGEMLQMFGDPTSLIGEDGRVYPSWESNMALAKLPEPLVIGWDHTKVATRVYCHEKIVDIVQDTFQDIRDSGYWELLNTYDGCYNWRPKRGQSSLSVHCWGLAIDLNAATNQLGNADGDMPMEIVEVFRKHQWIWGGEFKNPDKMHFQWVFGY